MSIHNYYTKCTLITIRDIFEDVILDSVWISNDQLGMKWSRNYIHYVISDFEWMFVVDETIHIFDIVKGSVTIKFTIPREESDDNINIIQILQHVHKYIIV